MNSIQILKILCLVLVFTSCGTAVKTNSTKEKSLVDIYKSPKHILEIIDNVNTYWQKQHPEPGNAFWHVSAYHTGNMEA